MSVQEKDGGPALPSVGEGFNNPLYSAPGMSLRDWFAGQALAGICSMCGFQGGPWPDLARHAYQAADAMLAERQQED